MLSNLNKYCFALVVYFSIAIAFAAESPLHMLQTINENILMVLNKNQSQLKNNPGIIESAIKQYFLPHVDTTGMSRSVLGRQAWMKASLQEKAQFTHEFTQLVLRTYAGPLTNYAGEKVDFLPLKPSSNPAFVQINSVIIRPNGQRIPVTYHLVQNAQNEWKVYDLSVEGISLLNSFRNQFGQALQNEELSLIISRLHKKNL